jgi:hypothetical protein
MRPDRYDNFVATKFSTAQKRLLRAYAREKNKHVAEVLRDATMALIAKDEAEREHA